MAEHSLFPIASKRVRYQSERMVQPAELGETPLSSSVISYVRRLSRAPVVCNAHCIAQNTKRSEFRHKSLFTDHVPVHVHMVTHRLKIVEPVQVSLH